MKAEFDQNDLEQGYAWIRLTRESTDSVFYEQGDSIGVGKFEGENPEYLCRLQPLGEEKWNRAVEALICEATVEGDTVAFLLLPGYVDRMGGGMYEVKLLGKDGSPKGAAYMSAYDVSHSGTESSIPPDNPPPPPPPDGAGKKAEEAAAAAKDARLRAEKAAQKIAGIYAAVCVKDAAKEIAEVRRAEEDAASAAQKAAGHADDAEKAAFFALSFTEAGNREKATEAAENAEEARKAAEAEADGADKAVARAEEIKRRLEKDQGNSRIKILLLAGIMVAALIAAYMRWSNSSESSGTGNSSNGTLPSPIPIKEQVNAFLAQSRDAEAAMQLAARLDPQTAEDQDAVFRLYFMASGQEHPEGMKRYAECIDPSMPAWGSMRKDGAEAWQYYGQIPGGREARTRLKRWTELEAGKGNAKAVEWLKKMR